jgi:hypothetical protein
MQTRWCKTALLTAAEYRYQVCHVSSSASFSLMPLSQHSMHGWHIATFWKYIHICNGSCRYRQVSAIVHSKKSHYFHSFYSWKWSYQDLWGGTRNAEQLVQENDTLRNSASDTVTCHLHEWFSGPEEEWMISAGKLHITGTMGRGFHCTPFLRLMFIIFYWLRKPLVSECYF